MLIYDIEIEKAILGKNEKPLEGIAYCKGWDDHAAMGVSCIGVYDYEEDRYRIFMGDNLRAFGKLVAERWPIVGFNSIAFDNAVMTHHGVKIAEADSYDILVELWRGAGLAPKFTYPTHMGFGLDAVCMANFGIGKTGSGAHAPVLFQKKLYGELIDYCLTDVHRTKKLLDKIIAAGYLLDPRDTTKTLSIRPPFNTLK
jgi:hypothetical protein